MPHILAAHGYGTLDNRTPIAPNLAAFIETLAALRKLETAYENSGREIQNKENYKFSET